MDLVKKNVKFIIGIIIGVIISSGISIYATASYLATQVNYTKANGTTTDVASVLDELYTYTSELTDLKSSIDQTDAEVSDILSGKKAYTKNGLITGTSNKKYTETEYKNYGEAQYNLAIANNGGIHIENFTLQPGYNHYNINFNPSLVFYISDGGICWCFSGDKHLYAVVSDSTFYEWDNMFESKSDGSGKNGFYMQLNGDSPVEVNLYAVK